MKERMKKYERWKDYFAIECFEVKIAIIVTAIITFCLFGMLSFYESFYTIQSDFKQVLLTILGGEFTLLGMSLAGMAIIVSLITPELIQIINSIDKEDTINRVLSHFEFSAFNLAIQAAYLLGIYLSFLSERQVIDKCFFVICFMVVCYHFFFNLFYIVALVGECINIYEIKNQCGKIALLEKSTIDVANEIRIDYILAILLRGKKKEQLLGDLFEMIDKSNISDKQAIKTYLKKYYG